MNFLAHAWLSFGRPEVLVGNMVSDFVKGKKKFDYPLLIQHGIQLHRETDAFTDAHPATAEAKEFFRPHYRLYSGAVVDVLYDYFLANDESVFPEGSLLPFSEKVYQTLESFSDRLPDRFRYMLRYMKSENWLYNYRTEAGIEKSLHGLARRAERMPSSDAAFEIFLKRRAELQRCYVAFAPAVKEMAIQKLAVLLA